MKKATKRRNLQFVALSADEGSRTCFLSLCVSYICECLKIVRLQFSNDLKLCFATFCFIALKLMVKVRK